MNSQETKLSVSEIIDQVSKQDETVKFLRQSGVQDIADIKSIEHYEVDENRQGIIVKIQKDGDDKIQSVIIDVKRGQPTTNRVFDELYGVGAECQIKFILFTGNSIESDRDDPGASYLVVQNFVKNIRKYGVDIRFVEVDSNPDKSLRFEIIEPEYNDVDLKTVSPLPTQETVRQHEFWDVYYWLKFDGLFDPWNCFEGNLHKSYECGHTYDVNGLDHYARLNEKGLSFEVRNSGGDYNYLDTIWKCKKYDLQALFPDSKVTYVITQGRLPRIIIEMWNTPMSRICRGSIPEKKYWADRILHEFGQLNELMSFAMGDLREGKLIEVQEFKQLSEVD